MSGWDKTKHGGKAVFDKGWAAFEKLGGPINKLTNKIGSEAFWPTGLGQESDKAARILKSMCKDGFYKDAPAGTPSTATASTPSTAAPKSSSPGPKNKPKVLVKIPQKVIQNAAGLAIFSVWRTGMWVSAAGGSGVLIARKDDGSWSPPSGILIHTVGVGFMAGIDVYDCVLVLNNRAAVDAFSKMRVSLGGEVSIVAGPLGAGGILESELYKNSKKPVFSYIKSRGLYGGAQIDGTIILERNDENANFYKERLPIGDILSGRVKVVPSETRMLMEVLKQADGRTDVDVGVVNAANNVPLPSDVNIAAMEGGEKHDYAHPVPPQYSPEAAHAYGVAPEVYHPGSQGVHAPQQNPEQPAHGPEMVWNPQTGRYELPQTAAYQQTPQYGQTPRPQDPSLYEASPAMAHSPHQFPPPPRSPMRTDSGFAPPPGPPHRTGSGFPAPPSAAPTGYQATAPEKQDPDGPPRYS